MPNPLWILAGVVIGGLLLKLPGVIAGLCIGLLYNRVAELTERVRALEGLTHLQSKAPAKPMSVSDAAPIAQPAPPQHHSPSRPEPPTWQPPPKPATSYAMQDQPRPSLIDRLQQRVIRFFTEGNPIVRIGMLVMFLGLAFLLKHAVGSGMFPVELRLAGAGAAAIALLAFGWHTREKQGGYGLVLQGGGFATLYLILFAANNQFQVLPAEVALGLTLALVLIVVALGVLQNAQVLALMATVGGFLAPILLAPHGSSIVSWFGLYLIMNGGVLAIALFKRWRLLNLAGFVMTFGVFAGWVTLFYVPGEYATAQAFLIGFFGQYLAVSVLFASRRAADKVSNVVDSSLTFGLPTIAFAVQYHIAQHIAHAATAAAIALAVLYGGLAVWLRVRKAPEQNLLSLSFAGIAAVFATLTVSLIFDGKWTSAVWALEAAGLVWIGLKQNQWLPRAAGYLVYLLALVAALTTPMFSAGEIPLVTGSFIGLVMLAVGALAISYCLERTETTLVVLEPAIGRFALCLGWGLWLAAGLVEVAGHVSGAHQFAAGVVIAALSTAGAITIGPRLRWNGAWLIGYSLAPVMAVLALYHEARWTDFHPFQSFGVLAIAGCAAVHYRFLWLGRSTKHAALPFSHFFGAVILLGLIATETSWIQTHFALEPSMAAALWYVALAAPLVLLLYLFQRQPWPVSDYPFVYGLLVPGILAISLVVWFVQACTLPGPSDLYVPVLNLLDIAQIAALVLLWLFCKQAFSSQSDDVTDGWRSALGALAFFGITVIALRAVHHFAGVAYTTDALWDSILVQVTLSILWTLCALVLTVGGERIKSRTLWIIGASLLGVVVFKLFIVDLSGVGTAARIVSFIGVGAIMLLIGYLAPLPAKKEESLELDI